MGWALRDVPPLPAPCSPGGPGTKPTHSPCQHDSRQERGHIVMEDPPAFDPASGSHRHPCLLSPRIRAWGAGRGAAVGRSHYPPCFSEGHGTPPAPHFEGQLQECSAPPTPGAGPHPHPPRAIVNEDAFTDGQGAVIPDQQKVEGSVCHPAGRGAEGGCWHVERVQGASPHPSLDTHLELRRKRQVKEMRMRMMVR